MSNIPWINEIFIKLIEKCKNNSKELPVASCIMDSSGNISEIVTNIGLKHAEMIITDSIYDLYGYSLFVTLEPCPCCLIALVNKRISYIFYGANNNIYKTNSVKLLDELNISHKTKFFRGFKSIETNNMLKKFFKNLRLL